MSSSYREELDRWISGIDVDADFVLDLGGSQLPAKGRTRSWNVKHYIISDLEEPHVGSPKPDLVIDLNTTEVGSLFEHYMFDVVFCLEVFDYVYDPMNAFAVIKSLLKAGGIAYVSFGLVYPTHNPIEDDMLRYTEFAIRKYAKIFDLEIVDIYKRRPETNAVELLWRNERMRAAKHYDHNVTGFIVTFKKKGGE